MSKTWQRLIEITLGAMRHVMEKHDNSCGGCKLTAAEKINQGIDPEIAISRSND